MNFVRRVLVEMSVAAVVLAGFAFKGHGAEARAAKLTGFTRPAARAPAELIWTQDRSQPRVQPRFQATLQLLANAGAWPERKDYPQLKCPFTRSF